MILIMIMICIDCRSCRTDCPPDAESGPRAGGLGSAVPQVLLLHVAQGQGGGGLPRHQVHSDTRQHRPQHPGNDSDKIMMMIVMMIMMKITSIPTLRSGLIIRQIAPNGCDWPNFSTYHVSMKRTPSDYCVWIFSRRTLKEKFELLCNKFDCFSLLFCVLCVLSKVQLSVITL